MPNTNWTRKIEILKAATDPEVSLRQIASRFNVSSGTVWNTLNEFTTTYQLTQGESDFPRKLLELYNINPPEEGGSDKLDECYARSNTTSNVPSCTTYDGIKMRLIHRRTQNIIL